MRFRSIKEVVDDFRRIGLELTRTHFRENVNKQSSIGRCEFIPVYWHDFLHGNETGIDERLKSITLSTVPKLRAFANDSVLDALFYTSPVYCQHIINTVTDEINRLYELFISRNRYFKGTVSLSGHSLGSVILFDILANQISNEEEEAKMNLMKEAEKRNDANTSDCENKKLTDSIIYNSATVNHGQKWIKYPKLKFKCKSFFALGSPISMFLTLRGITQISEHFYLPNGVNFFNIYHPLDPIAYRIEPMIKKEFINLASVVVPHHRGRKRMHLEIKENLAKISSDIKEKVLFGIKSTWSSVGNFVGMPRSNSNLSEINEQLNSNSLQQQSNNNNDYQELDSNFALNEDTSTDLYDDYTNTNKQIRIGSLNNGSRIDYVLQEKPIEFFNQYIFALTSHTSYWLSDDCILFIISKLISLNQNNNLDNNQSVKNGKSFINYDSNNSLPLANSKSPTKFSRTNQQNLTIDIPTSIDIE